MKKLFLTLFALASTAFAAVVAPAPAHAASAAPAVKSMAAVTPNWCVDDHSANYDVYDSSGAVVRANAIASITHFNYSTSGASVMLNSAYNHSNDGHTYQVSVHRWSNGSTTFNGPGGTFGGGTFSWNPSGNFWITVGSRPYYTITGYDVNRPAVGFHITYYPCGQF